MSIDSKKTYQEWWKSVPRMDKVDMVKQLYGYDLDISEITHNISDSEIEELYYFKDLLSNK